MSLKRHWNVKGTASIKEEQKAVLSTKSRRRSRKKKNYKKITGTMKKKLAGLFVLVVLALLCLLVRISYINAVSGDSYKKQVLSQSQNSYSSTVMPFKRGDIVDRNGIVLATSEKRYNVVFDCSVINSKEEYAGPSVQALVDVYGLDGNALSNLLKDERTRASRYQVVLNGITIEQKQAFSDYKNGTEEHPLTDEEAANRSRIHGIWFEEQYQRVYPLSSVACDVVGFTYDGATADWGIEGYYNNTLCGVNGRKFGYWEDESITGLSQTVIEPVDGDTVISTLDVNIQQICENEIRYFWDLYKVGPFSTERAAKNVGVIVMDPRDGKVLAMASSDPYDLNYPRRLEGFYSEEAIAAMSEEQMLTNLQAIWRNYCISDVFEPGSTYKPITVGAALEDGTLSGSEIFLCDGAENVAGTTIHCSEEDGHGELTLEQVIAYSCNDGLMQVVDQMGISEFIKYQSLFNFGSRTGIDLPGEAAGILFTEETMTDVDLAVSSFGQGFECTMIQEAAAVASIANGGYYYQPRVVDRIIDSKGTTKKIYNSTLLTQTVSNDNAEKLRSYMRTTVDAGTGMYAKVNGYSMGGKTGTAQKIPRSDGKYIVSFVGFVPYDDPQVLIYVVVDEPNIPDQDDNRFAMWIARDILTETLPYLNIYPDEEIQPMDEVFASSLEETEVTPPQADLVADMNVPEVSGAEDPANIAGGNHQESEGFTNEEAGLLE